MSDPTASVEWRLAEGWLPHRELERTWVRDDETESMTIEEEAILIHYNWSGNG